MAMAQQTPLRIAIIGLSASAVTNWAADAHLPGLLSEKGRKHYKVTALCNSSVKAAQNSIKHFNLPASTKAYGDPKSLANDPDIDLVICNTRVDKHRETLMPSIKAGKAVWVEWPVASNMGDVNEMYLAAQQSGSKVAVGLQGRFAPPVRKMNDIIIEGKVGKVLSTEVHVYGGAGTSRDTLMPGFEYFADRKVGGNHVTVLFGHMIDHVQNVLGSLARGSTHAQEQVQWPMVKTTEDDEVTGEVPSDAPDLFYVIGKLVGSSHVVEGASLLATYHRAWPLLQEPSQTWTITCENAIIRLRAYSYPSLQADAYDKPVTIEIHWYADGHVEDVEWKWEDETVPVRARSTTSSMLAFAGGRESGYADLKSAVDVSEQLEAWLSTGRW